MKRRYEWAFDDEPLADGTKTFGRNLQFLIQRTGVKNSNICNHLKISRTQLSRFINGLTYPKPHMIVALSELFGVDARILTHKLKQRDFTFGQGYRDISETLSKLGFFRNLVQKPDFMVPDQRTIEDGVYSLWYRPVLQPEFCYRSLAQVKTVNGARVIEQRDLKGHWSEYPNSGHPTKREIGVFYRSAEGFSGLHFVPNTDIHYCSSFKRHGGLRSDRYLGTGFWSVAGARHATWLQPIALEKLPVGIVNAVQLRHNIGFCSKEELPEFVREHFGQHANTPQLNRSADQPVANRA